MPNIASPSRIVIVALLLGCVADLLFHDRGLGVSFLIFVVALLLTLFLLGRLEGVGPVRRNLWLVAPLLYFSSMVFVRANVHVTMLNVAASVVLLALLVYFYAAGRVERLSVLGYAIVPFVSMTNITRRPRPLVRAGVPVGALRQQGVYRLLPVLRGVLIAFPVLLVFSCLLASADSIFAGLLGDLFSFASPLNVYNALWTVVIVLFFGWLAAGALVYALTRRAEPAAEHEPGEFEPKLTIGFIEAATVLLLVDLLFLLFAWIQFSYLFGMQEWAARGAWDYREYARRGFAELVIVSLLTLALILGLQRASWRETVAQSRVFQVLSSLMVLLVMVFLASAWQRMFYWEQVEAYMFTQKRIYVRVFLAWLGVTFVWLLVTLWAFRQRFATGAFAAVLGFIITLNVINPDARVVEYNLRTYAESGVIDYVYLHELSEDAIPPIVRAFEELPPTRREVLRQHLSSRLARMEHDRRWSEWQAFHLSRSEAYSLLVRYENLLR